MIKIQVKYSGLNKIEKSHNDIYNVLLTKAS